MSETHTAPSDERPVVVIGGGLAGLTAAAHLAERGVRTTVLEANATWLGGRLAEGEPASFQHGGREWTFPSEHGIHGLWGGYVNMRAMLERFAPATLAPVPSDGEVWVNRWGDQVRRVEAGTAVRSRLLPAPLHYLNLLFRPRFWGTITPLDFLSLPGVLTSLLWTVGYDPLREKSALRGLTMQDFFRGWTPNLRATIEGVARNMLAAPDDAITLTGLIAALRFYTMLRRDDWHPHFFPANSGASVINPLGNAIQANGGTLHNGVTVTQIERLAAGWRVVAHGQAGSTVVVDAAQVIIATHPSAAGQLLCNSASTRAAAQAIRFPSVLRNTVVRLWYASQPNDRAPSGMFTGDFVPDNYFWLDQIHQEFGEWAAVGGAAVELHFYGDDALLNQADRTLLLTAQQAVERTWPGLRGTFVHGTVRRNSKVHTAFEVMTDAHLHVQTPWDGLYACGDWVGYDTPSLWMERAVTTGVAAANAVLSTHNKPPFPIYTVNPPEPLARVLGTGVLGLRGLLRPVVNAARRARRGPKSDSA